MVESEDDLDWKRLAFGGCLLQPPAQSRADVSVRLSNVCDRKSVRLIMEVAYGRFFK